MQVVTSTSQATRDAPLRDMDDEHKKPIQMRPQKVEVELQIGESGVWMRAEVEAKVRVVAFETRRYAHRVDVSNKTKNKT